MVVIVGFNNIGDKGIVFILNRVITHKNQIEKIDFRSNKISPNTLEEISKWSTNELKGISLSYS